MISVPAFVVDARNVPDLKYSCTCREEEDAVDENEVGLMELRGEVFDHCVIDAQIGMRNQEQGPKNVGEAVKMMEFRLRRMTLAIKDQNPEAYVAHLTALMAIGRTMATDDSDIEESVLGLIVEPDE